MKRIYISAMVIVAGILYAAFSPEQVPMVKVLAVALFGCGALIISLVRMPVTEYIKVPYEVAVPNSFKYGINLFRDKRVICIMASGEEIEGVFRNRNDHYGIYSIEVRPEVFEHIPQAKLERIRTIGLENLPHETLQWDDTSKLLIPRSC